MKTLFRTFAVLVLALLLASCNSSRLTSANYDQITNGMSKAQVERILGKPTTKDTKDMILFSKSTWRWEDGKKFAIVTFKNDEVDSKDTNLGRDR
jgi:hypothetical protein